MTTLPLAPSAPVDCWNHIGVHGDHSCPELTRFVHCHNCTVFASVGRRFLDAPTPPGYLEEWTQRLAAPIVTTTGDLLGVLIFRLGDEWLALPVGVLVEVTQVREAHRIPHRGGVLAGLINIRGELHLSAHLDQVLGLRATANDPADLRGAKSQQRLLVVQREGERWVFTVDEVDQVRRFPTNSLVAIPATVQRAVARLSRGVFHWKERAIGLLDDERLFQTLRTRLR
jgi:chemotaxis-related protein WspD